MKFLITDSGLGGLSMLARLVVLLEYQRINHPYFGIDIFYVNAVPRDNYGYNEMSTREEQIQIFNRILKNVDKIYDPNQVYVACGSLSAFLNKVPFVIENKEKIRGIGEIGKNLLEQMIHNHPLQPVFVFATPTTVKEGLYSLNKLINEEKSVMLVEQSCPGLASMISSNSDEKVIQNILYDFCQKALKSLKLDVNKFQSFRPIIFLGCTHYSFRQELFIKVFKELGFQDVTLVDPIPEAASLLSKEPILEKQEGGIQIKFITPYHLPEKEKKTVFSMLNYISPLTGEAFLNGSIVPELIS
jgi:glutamate racemase